jgi:two-component system sensor histidine kinase KdpD
VAAVPVGRGEGRILVAYAARKKGVFGPDEVNFLHSVARHLAAGLGKASVHEDLARHRGRLEQGATRTSRKTQGSRRAVDHMRERLLSNFPSEMRTTVATISSAARALSKYRGAAEQREQILGSIVGSADLLQHQLDDLSRLIRVADGKPLRLAAIPPRRLIKEALRIAGHDHVRFKLDEPVKLARFDLQGLARAVAHLIDNAVKFSRSGTSVSVHMRTGQLETAEGGVDAMVISVLDRGQGVPNEDRERIFAPFATGKKATSGKSSGLGIGLYEARSQARRHGGTLQYFPRKGGGSEFRLTVPLQPIAEPVVTEVTHA